MLVHLSIRDIVLIERLDLDMAAGLSVLTGETGAGKSILLDSLSLALGARGDGGLVRAGAERGEVSATFELAPDSAVQALLAENGREEPSGDVILRRIQNPDGRTRGFINDQPASASLMKEVGRLLVEIHGQHDERALVDTEIHRLLLDQYGGLLPEATAVGRAHREWREATRELAAARKKVEAAEREAEFLRSSVEELSDLAPIAGEEEELAERRQTMMRSEKIAADINDAVEELSGPQSPIPPLAGLLKRLDRKSHEMPGALDAPIERLDVALDALSEAQTQLEQVLRDLEFDPKALESCEERLFALRAAGRKYQVAVDELPELAARMVDDLSDLDAGAERLAVLEETVAAKAAVFGTLAAELSRKRQTAARLLEGAVMAELPDLKLERAEFIVAHDTDPDRPGPGGIDQIAFHVRTNPGTRAGPMMKIASGGELSRFLLALKVALAERGSAPTLVFDEIDTGVGGAVADAIGRRLARLSASVQVLAVTHAPQVAARASRHLLISKQDAAAGEGRVATRVNLMSEADRREEIARMLAGEKITEEARAAAARLIGATGS